MNNDPPIRYSGVVNVPPDVARVVQSYMREHGEKAAMEHFRMSRISITRTAAGLTIHRGSLLSALDGIARLESAGE